MRPAPNAEGEVTTHRTSVVTFLWVTSTVKRMEKYNDGKSADKSMDMPDAACAWVLNSYTLAGEWGTGSHLLGVPRIDVSRHSIRLGETKHSKAFKSKE